MRKFPKVRHHENAPRSRQFCFCFGLWSRSIFLFVCAPRNLAFRFEVLTRHAHGAIADTNGFRYGFVSKRRIGKQCGSGTLSWGRVLGILPIPRPLDFGNRMVTCPNFPAEFSVGPFRASG
jgi:hypothetical protein